MSPELLEAIKQRIKLNHSDESITAELQQAGYDKDTVTLALQVAKDTVDEPVPLAQSNQLPTFQTLFSSAQHAVIRRYDLALLLMIPPVLLVFVEFFNNMFLVGSNAVGSVFVELILPLIVTVAYMVLLFSVMYIVAHSKERDVTVKESLVWTKQKIWGLILVNILTSLAIFGGLLLLLIPGFIVSIYIYLAQFVYIKEGVPGFKALFRSRELVTGNWWYVLVRLLLLVLVIIILTLVITIFAVVTLDPTNLSPTNQFIFDLVNNIINVFITLFSLFYVFNIYEALSAKKPLTEINYDNTFKYGYRFLVLIGTTAIVALIAFVCYVIWSAETVSLQERWEDGTVFTNGLSTEELKQRAQDLD